MKKRMLVLIAVVAVVMICAIGMTSCGNGLSAEKAAEMIAGFKTNPTTVSGIWEQDFKLDVNSDNQSFKAFAQDLKATVSFEMDLTEGNLYYYAKRTTDAGDSFEEIVVKSEGKYYYKSTALNPVELESETAALAKIKESFKALTTEKSGWLDADAFLYDSAWVTDYIMLGSTNVTTGEGRNFAYTYEKTKEGGLKIALDAKYVGYTGDSGIVDVGTNATMTGSHIDIETNKEGQILSLAQSVNNYIEFNITNPPIPLLYTGTRTLTASYGAVAHKSLDDVAMTATGGSVTITKGTNVLKAELFDFDLATMNFDASSSAVAAGHYVAIKVSCGAGYEVESVKINGAEATNMNGYYCHMQPVVAGAIYEVEITAKQTAEGPVNTKANATVTAADGITYELYDFDYGTFAFNPSTGEIEQGHFIAIKITSTGEVVVKVDGNEATAINGYYCYMQSVTAGQNYAVTIELKGEDGPALTGPATVTVNAPDGVTYELYDFKYDGFVFTPTTSEITEGNYIALKITSEGTYNVTVNGAATQNMNGYYCLMTPVAAGTSYTVTIEDANAPASGNVTVDAPADVEYKLYDFALPMTFKDTENEVAVGNYIALEITSGHSVTVTVNGNPTTLQGGKYYCYMTAIEEGKSYVVTIEIAE